jgi:hypothetical protein
MRQPEQWQLSGNAAELYERYVVPYFLGPWAPGLVEWRPYGRGSACSMWPAALASWHAWRRNKSGQQAKSRASTSTPGC